MDLNRNYSQRVAELDPSEQYVTYQKGKYYYEIPKRVESELETQERLDSHMLETATLNFKKSQCRDDVYVDQEIVRQDYTTAQPEGVALVQILQDRFPDYVNYTRWDYNFVGSYGGYREPYENNSISFYDFGINASEELQLRFGTSYLISDLYGWYGLKFDLVTDEVMLKMVFKTYDDPRPEFPSTRNLFFARTHFTDGTSSDWVDAYIYATPKVVKNFCAENNLTYPLNDNEHLACDVIWCWGFVFHKDTQEYGAVKAYSRYNLPDEV